MIPEKDYWRYGLQAGGVLSCKQPRKCQWSAQRHDPHLVSAATTAGRCLLVFFASRNANTSASLPLVLQSGLNPRFQATCMWSGGKDGAGRQLLVATQSFQTVLAQNVHRHHSRLPPGKPPPNLHPAVCTHADACFDLCTHADKLIPSRGHEPSTAPPLVSLASRRLHA